MTEKSLGTIISPDGERRVTFNVDASGYFSFVEDTWQIDDLTEFGFGVERYWSPSHLSGLYGTEAEARADAASILPWLRNM